MTIVLQNYWFGDVHEDVHHCGVATTLNKLRQTYWIIKRRQTVKKVLSKCIITFTVNVSVKLYKVKRYYHYWLRSFLSLEFILNTLLKCWIRLSWPIIYTRYFRRECRNIQILYTHIYMCSYTEYSSRIGTSGMLLHAICRFMARKGLPRALISDNFKTFKSKEVKHLILSLNIK